jgi:hypothetical protein
LELNGAVWARGSEGIAKVESYFFVLHIDKGAPPAIRGGGRYHDKFARTDGVWHFTAKRMDLDRSDA